MNSMRKNASWSKSCQDLEEAIKAKKAEMSQKNNFDEQLLKVQRKVEEVSLSQVNPMDLTREVQELYNDVKK